MQCDGEMGCRAATSSTELSTGSVDKGEAQIEPSARSWVARSDGVPGMDGPTLAESRAEFANPLETCRNLP
jgi:hypothetical protein